MHILRESASVSPSQTPGSEIYAFRGEAVGAFEWLEWAYARREGGLTEMKGALFAEESRARSAIHRLTQKDSPAGLSGSKLRHP